MDKNFSLSDEGLLIFRDDYCLRSVKLTDIVQKTPDDRQLITFATINGYETLASIEDYLKYYDLKEGHVAIDVGAHVGVISKIFSEKVGNTGIVVSFEPDARALGCLVKNCIETKNVKIFPYAIWFCQDVLPMFYYPNGLGTSSITTRTEIHDSTSDALLGKQTWQPVVAITLDSFVKNSKIEHVNFIKIDIEGSEIYALRGMTETLKITDALAVASYHEVKELNGRKSFPLVMEILEEAGFNVRLEKGFDGEIVYANRIV